jgi:hypothetical protein
LQAATPKSGAAAEHSAPPVAGAPPAKQTEDEKRAQIAKNPSEQSPASHPGETPQQAKERTDKAREEFKKSGGTERKITGPVQKHHAVSNKAHEAPAAKESVEILENAQTSGEPDLLTSEENIVSVEDHGDAHGENYHVIVRNRLKAAVDGKTPHTPEYRQAVLTALRAIKAACQTPGTVLNLMSKKISAGGIR